MVRLCCFSQVLLLAVAAFMLTSHPRLISASPRRGGAAGVFLFIEEERYTLNFTAARAACLHLNVTMATTAHMERALQEGLETCKFGWIHEQIAVVPRLTSDLRCGSGNTGVVRWHADPERQFAVFCYNASALEEIQKSSPARPLSSTSRTTPPTAPPATHSAPPTDQPKRTESHFTETFAEPVGTTRPTGISSTSAPHPLSTLSRTSPPQLVTTKPADVTSGCSSAVRTIGYHVTSEQAMLPSGSPPETTLGAGPTALIITGAIALLLMLAGTVWYYKLDKFPWYSQGGQKDDTETEMWKHADSEADLHHRRGEEEEEEEEEDEEDEPERKYSSDITLCVSPSIRADASE